MKTYLVDSFTKEPFKGNPAAVCFPDHELPDTMMLKIAREFGFSETAFLYTTPLEKTFSIRYFSPKKEIPLCGHATLAAAKVLCVDTSENELHFITRENLDLVIWQKGPEIMMEFPVFDTVEIAVSPLMIQALGLPGFSEARYSPKNKIILLEIPEAAVLANLKPDFNALLNSAENINGVLVTAPGNSPDFDYHYRYFWPWAGTQEDPVTGGVQTFLAKFWAEKLGKSKMKAFQSSARTGYMQVELANQKVLISSEAVILLSGELHL
jgi:PhzF family phenazine biosynthesis protein